VTRDGGEAPSIFGRCRANAAGAATHGRAQNATRYLTLDVIDAMTPDALANDSASAPSMLCRRAIQPKSV